MNNHNFIPSDLSNPAAKNSASNKKRLYIIVSILSIGLIFVGLGLYWYFSFHPHQKGNISVSNKITKFISPKGAFAESFASWTDFPVKVNPQVPNYTINADWSNVDNYSAFSFSPTIQKQLKEHYFAIQKSNWKHFWPGYEENRYDKIPNFITADSILHTYHVYFDGLLGDVEEEKLSLLLKDFAYRMEALSTTQYQELRGTKWENAAKRNLAFFAVVDKLINPEAETPPVVKNEVENELSLIAAHQGIDSSPVMNIGKKPGMIVQTPQGKLPVNFYNEDYSQYVPRGHYTRTEGLKRYFKAMMYLGRMNFRLIDPDETKSAILISLNIANHRPLQDEWEKIYQPTAFFVGKSDDLDFYNYKFLIDKVYGNQCTLSDLAKSSANQLNQFLKLAEGLRNPRINSMPIFEAGVQSNRNKEIKGFRVMGQRFTIDASIFQRLLYREVGNKSTDCAHFDPEKVSCLNGARCLPKGLDIPAAMGSSKALDILNQQGETQYACYSENLSKMKQYLAGLDKSTWTQNLYWGWLYSLKPLLQENFKSGYPMFMQNQDWSKESLNTYLGSWTELKHDTILYAKQVYAELGGGGGVCCKLISDDRGYVEPYPKLYSRLASLTKMTKDGLLQRGLISSYQADVLNLLVELCQRLQNISEKELNNQPLSADDYELIRSYGGSLEHFWVKAMAKRYCYSMYSNDPHQLSDCLSEIKQESKKPISSLQEWAKNGEGLPGEERDFLDKERAALVADVATDPNGSVLEEAVGPLFDIYVVVPTPGKNNQLKIAKGIIFSHYEFRQPMGNRLTDEKWHQMIDKKNLPPLPQWFSSLANDEKSVYWFGQWRKIMPGDPEYKIYDPQECSGVKCNHCPAGYSPTQWGCEKREGDSR